MAIIPYLLYEDVAGATILEEPKNTAYGHRRYGAEDPEGHQWYFAQEIRRRSRAGKPRKTRKSG